MTCANINKIKIFRCFLLGGCLIISEVFHGSLENDLREGNQLAEDEPVVDHLGGGGGGQALHLADEDRRHHQHGCEVDAQGCLEVDRLEQGCGKGDQGQEDGGEEGRHHLAHHLPLQDDQHPDSQLGVGPVHVEELLVSDLEQGHVLGLPHVEELRAKSHSLQVQGADHHLDPTFLE